MNTPTRTLVGERDLTTAPADPRHPDTRLGGLLDPGSAQPLPGPEDTEVTAVRGLAGGERVIAFCTNAAVKGGALGAGGATRIVTAIDQAIRECCPVIGVWHSGGAKLTDGVESMDGVGRVFAAITRASGLVPQLSVVVGPAAGAAAYGPALTDLVIMSRSGRMFVTGPDVVRSVTGEQIDMETLGGIEAHGRRSGVVHMVTESEADAYAGARLVVGLLSRRGVLDPRRAASEAGNPGELLPASPRRAYDVRPLIRRLLDTGHEEFAELQARWAPNIVIGWGRLGSGTVGVVASNPLRKGGCLDSQSAEKAARFVQLCDTFGIPLLVIVDVPGYLPGVREEWDGVVRRGAKLLHAFARATVPRVTLVTRKAYGGAYIAMNSRSLGATAVFAWPGAEVAVMGAEAAVGVLHQKRLAAAPEHEREALLARLVEEQRTVAGGVSRAQALGVVDELIDPRDTRRRVAEALATAPARHERHTNIPL